ncbi:MAG: hypothetical protein NVS2B2_38710 [Ktedonobacteraceae bacterium]
MPHFARGSPKTFMSLLYTVTNIYDSFAHFRPTNAFGATIQEVQITTQYMTDQTTNYSL